jgi:hypothetical protein
MDSFKVNLKVISLHKRKEKLSLTTAREDKEYDHVWSSELRTEPEYKDS